MKVKVAWLIATKRHGTTAVWIDKLGGGIGYEIVAREHCPNWPLEWELDKNGWRWVSEWHTRTREEAEAAFNRMVASVLRWED